MGYTHYWYRPPKLDKNKWKHFVSDAARILKVIEQVKGRIIAEEDDLPDRDAVVSSKLVRFNGIGDEGHETFYIEREMEPDRTYDAIDKKDGFEFACTKTAQKPYDIAVCAVLIAAWYNLRDDIRISSDGDEEDWAEAKALCQEKLGYGAQFDIWKN